MVNRWIRAVTALCLFTAACGSPPPPAPSGPTAGERVAYQEGQLDGRKAERAKWEAAIKEKEEELKQLQDRLTGVQLEGAGLIESLRSCRVNLLAAEHRVVELEQSSREQQEIGARCSNGVGAASEAVETEDAEEPRSCCKICRKGKACGNSCISRAYTCHKGPGCACDG